jgi:hypothetical protein
VNDGSVTYDATPYYRPVASGPLEGEVIVVLKIALFDALASAAELDSTDYTSESWAALSVAVQAGQNVYDDPEATQQEVDSAEQAINSAIAGLVNYEPLPTVIGEAWGGGYYIGNITTEDGEDAGTYAVVMAGAEAQFNLQWKTERSTTAGTDSTTNGLANTLAMQAAGLADHPAAEYCLNYEGGGWYLPAAGELNLAWENRSNLSALEMDEDWYWSSTQHSSLYARVQRFSDGIQSSPNKNVSYRGRPVRRLLVSQG